MSKPQTRGPIVAARGGALRCLNWRAEGLLRLLENVLEVGERPAELIVYAALGKAARDWDCYDAIVDSLRTLREDQTLVLQSGMPIGVMATHQGAPMVLSAVNNTVGNWSDQNRFYERAAAGRTMWGGLTAAAWQYIGRQGVLQGTYELLRTVVSTHFPTAPADGPTGRWLLTAGLGGMGSAQPISARLAGLCSLTAEVDAAKIGRLQALGAIDQVAEDVSEAVELIRRAIRDGELVSVALCGNAATVVDAVLRCGSIPDIVTDQTAAHDIRYGYVPEGYDLDEWQQLRERQPERVEEDAQRSIAKQVRSMLALQERGSVTFENGNNLRAQALLAGVPDAYVIPGFMQRYLRPLFAQGIGPFRWIVLSGSTKDLSYIDDLAASLFPERPEVGEWIRLARTHIPTQGLPARSCWLGHGERDRIAAVVNDAVASGQLSAPVAFTRDHLDAAAMTHPRIGTEGMKDDSDGVTDWPLLDAMLVSASGADLVAVHSGGGGYSGWMQSAGVTVIADGSALARQRLRMSLSNDTGLGVLRYATAGYPEATAALSAHADDEQAPRWLGLVNPPL